MNKYEEYLDIKEFINAALFCSDVLMKEYYRKKDIRDKIYFYTKFRDSLIKIIDDKKSKEIKNIKEKKYSDSDIEFLRQFKGFDLTLEEACLVGKRDEYYNFLRLISYKMGKTSRKLDQKIDEEIQKLNGDYTPRLVWEFYNKHKKGRKS